MPYDVRRHPAARPDRLRAAGRRPSTHLVRRDRRPPARRLHARRQRRANWSLLIGFSSMIIGVVIGTIVGVDRRLLRRLRRQRPDAHRRRHAQPAAPVRHPRRRPVLRPGTTSGRSSSSSGCSAGWASPGSSGACSCRIREREFVEAAQGRRRPRPADHLPAHPAQRPRARSSSSASLIVAGNIIGEAFVSFLGFGVNPITPTLGQHPLERADVHRRSATGGGRSSRAWRSSSPSSPSTSSATACATPSTRGRGHDRGRSTAPTPRGGAAAATTSCSRSATCGPTSTSWTAPSRPSTASSFTPEARQDARASSASRARGKSVTALTIMRLLDIPPAEIALGRDLVRRARDPVACRWSEMRKLRGNDMAMIFQEPMTSLNPVFTVGDQIAEQVERHKKVTQEGRLGPRDRVAPAGRHPVPGAPGQAVPPRDVGRHAPARDDRDGPRRASPSC